MGKGSYILGGALQGIGAGLIAQGQQRAEEQARSATQAFSEMMAKRQSDAADARSQRESDAAAQLEERKHGWRTEEATTNFNRSVQLKGMDFKQAKEMAELNARLEQEAKRLASELGINEAKIRAAMETGETLTAANGQRFTFNKRGEIISKSAPGMYNPPNSKAADGSKGGKYSAEDVFRDGQGKPLAATAAPTQKAPGRPAPTMGNRPQRHRSGEQPVIEDGYRYTPGPGGKANPQNWTKI